MLSHTNTKSQEPVALLPEDAVLLCECGHALHQHSTVYGVTKPDKPRWGQCMFCKCEEFLQVKHDAKLEPDS